MPKSVSIPASLLILAAVLLPLALAAQETAITYQGQLRESGEPFNGTANLQFQLYDALVAGSQVGTTVVLTEWPVEDGLFQVELDFGAGTFDGSQRFLEVWVDGAPLDPRQKVTAMPFALLAAGTLSGVVGGGEIDPAEVQLRVTGNCPAGQYVREIGQNGSVVCGIDDAGSPAWRLDGNAGTDPAANFLGTTDAAPLEFRTANVRSLRIEPSAELFDGLPITANVIAGSHANEVTAGVRGATISGGGVPSGNSDPQLSDENSNRVTDHYGTVSGGFANLAGDNGGTAGDKTFATVGGGRKNIASGSQSTVGGGGENTAMGAFSNVGGGGENTARGGSSTVGGGGGNTVMGSFSTVAGGGGNIAMGGSSTVAGGLFNTASGFESAVGGGSANTASGNGSTVAGGRSNCAGGRVSWAGGEGAKVRPGTNSGTAGDGCDGIALSSNEDGDEGTFVWADSQLGSFISTGDNQFLVRAAGGVGINTNAPETSLHVLGPSPDADPFGQLRLEGEETTGAAGTGAGISFLGHDGNIRRIWGYIQSVKENGTVGNTRSRMSFYTRGLSGLPVERFRIDSNGTTFNQSGSWAVFSDQRLKKDIEQIADPLDRLLALQGIRYRYTDPAQAMGAAGRRMGFVAQQVAEVFPEWVGEDERGFLYLSMTGFEALTVEALRGLQQRFEQKIARKNAELADIREQQAERFERMAERNSELEARLAALEALLLEGRAVNGRR